MDDDKLFRVGEDVGVIFGGVVNVLVAVNPYGVWVVPYRLEKMLVPVKVGEVREGILVEILEENPVAGYKTTDDWRWVKPSLLLEDLLHDGVVPSFVERWIGVDWFGWVMVCSGECCDGLYDKQVRVGFPLPMWTKPGCASILTCRPPN